MSGPILQHPDDRLRQVCVSVDDPRSKGDLIEQMFELMYEAPGRGLAAPQIGFLERIFVMDPTWKEGEMTPQAFINPHISEHSEAVQVNEEACLSIADVTRQIARPEWVRVEWLGLDGTAQSGRFDGFAAACICHEVDHLDGRLILDHPEVV